MTKFGLQIPNFTFADVPDREMFEHVADLAVAGEQAGFDSVWVMDHFWQLPPLGGPTQPMLEAYTLLGGLIVRELMHALRVGHLIDPLSIRRLVGAAMEFLIVAALARMRAWNTSGSMISPGTRAYAAVG